MTFSYLVCACYRRAVKTRKREGLEDGVLLLTRLECVAKVVAPEIYFELLMTTIWAIRKRYEKMKSAASNRG